MASYHYTECGLDNVFIEGMNVLVDDHGEEVYCIPNVNELHREIARAIVTHEAAMSGAELRFLRTELGLTQAELAKLVHCDQQTIGRWEREETPIANPAEVVIRLYAIEELKLGRLAVQTVSEKCIPSANLQPINIQANDAGKYELAA